MQGAEHQVSGFRSGQRQADGFQIAQLADQDVIRVFTQRRAQRLVEAVRIAVHFALVDQAFVRGVDEFDWVLDGEDMAVFVLVDVVHHRRQRGRLARTGRAGDQDQALRLVDQFAEHLGRGQVVQRQHLGGNGTEHRTGATVLVEGVDAETRQTGDLEGEVDFEQFLEIAPHLVGHDVVDQRMDLFVVQRRDIDTAHVAIDADHRRQAGRQVQVRSLVLHRKGEKFCDIHVPVPLGRFPVRRSRDPVVRPRPQPERRAAVRSVNPAGPSIARKPGPARDRSPANGGAGLHQWPPPSSAFSSESRRVAASLPSAYSMRVLSA